MKKIAWLVPLGILLAIQIFRPDMTNPKSDPGLDINQVLNPPQEVYQTLKTACYDCHSNETEYPWYSQIAPVSWWIVDHIQEGREHLNFSTLGSLSAEDRSEMLEEAAEAVQEGEMPLKSYTWVHPAAKLDIKSKDLLLNWLNTTSQEAGLTTDKFKSDSNPKREKREEFDDD